VSPLPLPLSHDPRAPLTLTLQGTFYKAFAAGTALYGTASIFYRFTGSIFNPSVSLALALTGVIRPVRFLRTYLSILPCQRPLGKCSEPWLGMTSRGKSDS
jgi:hypothetical protein